MSIKNDSWIRDFSEHYHMIDPYVETCPSGVVSYGLSSYGYDIRISNKFMCFAGNGLVADPKCFDPKITKATISDTFYLPPHSFALAKSVEYLRIPREVLVLCVGKSTYARCGLVVNVTPLEPEWEGVITLELSNTTNIPIVIYANEGIAQLLFFESDDTCEYSYADKGGKYQFQQDITLPFCHLKTMGFS